MDRQQIVAGFEVYKEMEILKQITTGLADMLYESHWDNKF